MEIMVQFLYLWKKIFWQENIVTYYNLRGEDAIAKLPATPERHWAHA